MSLLTIDFASKMLSRKTVVSVIIPSREKKEANKWPVVWLLHGAMGGHSDWQRMTNIEVFAEKYGFAVVMGSGDCSFYANCPTGRYFDFFTQELPELLCRMLPLSQKREDNIVAGFSMGGHGAYKLGLACPEKYSGIVVFSAGNFIETAEMPSDSPFGKVHQAVFGTTHLHELAGTEHDVKSLAKTTAEKGVLPKIFVTCGLQDGGYPIVKSTCQYMKELGFSTVWTEAEGIHDWMFINHMLPVATDWISNVLSGREE